MAWYGMVEAFVFAFELVYLDALYLGLDPVLAFGFGFVLKLCCTVVLCDVCISICL